MTTPHKALEQALGAQQDLIRAYVNLLENGRDRILQYGGTCDPVDVMEANDPALHEAKAALTEGRKALAEHIPDAGEMVPADAAAAQGEKP